MAAGIAVAEVPVGGAGLDVKVAAGGRCVAVSGSFVGNGDGGSSVGMLVAFGVTVGGGDGAEGSPAAAAVLLGRMAAVCGVGLAVAVGAAAEVAIRVGPRVGSDDCAQETSIINAAAANQVRFPINASSPRCRVHSSCRS